jgi:hypothetical protein
MNKMTDFKTKWAWGEEGEAEVKKLLLDQGNMVLTFEQFHPVVAPVMEQINEYGLLSCYTAPDILVLAPSHFLVECKRKRNWVRFSGELETGIDERFYRQYARIEEITGLPVWLYFIHEVEEPFGIFRVPLKNYTRMFDGNKSGNSYPAERFYNFNVLQKIQ